MSASQSRRGFMRGLVTLPLIGGGVTLTGSPANGIEHLFRRKPCPLSAAQILALHLRPGEEDLKRLWKVMLEPTAGEARS